MKKGVRDGGIGGAEVDNAGGGGVERTYESLRHWTPTGGVMDTGREGR